MAPRTRRRLVIVGVVLVLVVLAVGGALGLSDDGGAPAAVSVGGRDVSGLDAGGVERVARARAAELLARPVEITRADDPGFRMRVSPEGLGARPRIRRAVEAALEPRAIGGRLLSLVGAAPRREVPLTFTLTPRRVQQLVNRVTRRINDPPVAATLEVTEDDIVVVPGESGFGVPAAELRDRIADLPASVVLEPGPLPPPVSDEEAEAAREIALRVVSAPVEVTLGGNGVPI